jgi:hypothetical protein|eukprot:CAMPEP_0169107102 /NCGR_PEP_ID=MMETSP1015-20121227/24701_1 /TAXON_ID=342587 /ORGANISM="Karlodinium micrum, Strain CCMP2283" /LENGTH=241 /DNA_ID=CAMNT_0009168607 /DNA_START=67 /DNA_END=792 /DNA_ORIENTATION=+
MPPRKYKTNHRRGYQGGGFDDMVARNEGLDGFDPSKKGKGKGKGKSKDEPDSEEESGSEEEEEQTKAPAKKTDKPEGFAMENPNAKVRNEDKEGTGELSRKQREELEKEAARRRYEAKHKAGETDEAKADLARLAEVKKRREEAAKKRLEDEAATKQAEAEKLASKGGRMSAEVKDALGGEAARLPGERSKIKTQTAPRVKNDVNLYSYVDGAGEKPKEAEDFAKNDGSINACRAAEDDFM